ncbi:hypothetical protein DPMN_192372 [Dreissena polymorpha]|uniref:Uncharacterized protein n=1 Tax=Dreissena polymorpha TaxID=45954 RepID=A0A9D3Y1L8_DREPO|nr:hypothetical protein DPMN_192372 [Dreissena polymorpha]
MFVSVLQVPRGSLRLSYDVADGMGLFCKTVWDCPTGAPTILVPLQIVWESPGTGFGCRQSVKRQAVVV